MTNVSDAPTSPEDVEAAGPPDAPPVDASSVDTFSVDAPSVDASPVDASFVDALPPRRSRRRRRLMVALTLLLPVLVVFVALVSWYSVTREPLTNLPGLRQDVPHYVFSIYGVTHPIGVAVTGSGDRIYVTQSDGARVVGVYDRAGRQVGVLKPPDSTGASHVPVYVAVNPTNGDVYVSDRITATVYVYSSKGDYLRAFVPGGDLGGGWAPLGLAFDPSGGLYVSDVGGATHRILVFGPDGVLRRSMGAVGQLSFPNGIVVDGRGNIEVSDSNNGRVVVFDPAGTVLAAITRGVGEGDLGLPRGTAVDDSGRLYVVDTSNHAVRMYHVGDANAPVPRYLGSFGEEGTLDGRFEFPNGVAADNRARIYVTDRENDRVQVWSF